MWLFFKVNVVLKFTDLPPFPEYTFDLCRFPHEYGPIRPVSMEGLVIAVTRVTKYTQGARYLCENDDCPCSRGNSEKRLPLFLNHFFLHLMLCIVYFLWMAITKCSGFCTLAVEFTFYLCSLMLQLGFHHIRVHAPGATESATVGNTFSCLICSSQLKEDVKFRVLGGERFSTGYKILKENSFVVIFCKCVFGNR